MAEKLESYNKKRDFKKTGEPKGKAQRSSKKLRFVMQHHIASRDHFDVRLEWNGALVSWAVPKGPSFNVGDKRLAVKVEDHPLDYRNFEGTIPKGEYGGGTVMIWDEGLWQPRGDAGQGLGKGSLKFVLEGKRLKGSWALVRMKAKPNDKNDNWLLVKEDDEYAKKSAGIENFKSSVRTGRTMSQIERGQDSEAAKNPFKSADVQLAKLADTVPKSGDWVYEVKYDGYRILAFIERDAVRLVTRNRHDYTKKFKAAAQSLREWADSRAMILDGEMAVMDSDGKTDFQALQNYIRNPEKKSLRYIVFDILALDGVDLRDRQLIERKEILKKLMKDAPANLFYSAHVKGKGRQSLKAACRMKLEGVIGKKANSTYSGTRNGDWIKIKCETRQQFVICGYTRSNKKTSGISSVILGVLEDDRWKYVGRAGGMSQRTGNDLEHKFKGITRKTAAFKEAPKPRSNEIIVWLRPRFTAEIRFAEWTKDGHLRHAVFLGLREDKDVNDADKKAKPASRKKTGRPAPGANECVVEKVKITSPDKIIFDKPKTTKEDVAKYYRKVAKRMMPYLDNRLISAIRCPEGAASDCFFKKHPAAGSKGIVAVPLENSAGDTSDFFYIPDVFGLISEVQMNTLEFHVWGSCADNLERPDIMVFDLDPDEGMNLKKVRRGVRDLKSILDELSLVSYLKTSGGKGYHVVVPLKPTASWREFSDFAKNIAKVMEEKWPDRYTSNVRKASRKGKIFIDWIRNSRGATSVAPYSVRARRGAPVSMPISWRELDAVAPGGINMDQALKRLARKDPWDGFFKNSRKLV